MIRIHRFIEEGNNHWWLELTVNEMEYHISLYDDDTDGDPVIISRINPEGSKYSVATWSGTVEGMNKKIKEIIKN